MNNKHIQDQNLHNYPVFNPEPLDDDERLDMEAVSLIKTKATEDNPAWQEYKEKLKASSRKISINVQNRDVEAIQNIAKQSGIPYQTLISSILHRYATGQINIKKAF